MAKLAIELAEKEAEQLNEVAEKMGVPPHELVHAAIIDLINNPDPSFIAAVERTIEKNRELYKRLA